jgi:NhaP-type Na+/H+ or K+/H+ antiporter
LVVPAVGGIAYTLAEVVGGNGFIASFVGGMIFGSTARRRGKAYLQFVENEGQLFVLATFFVFGAVMLPDVARITTPLPWVYAILSLASVLMVSVAVSLIGTGLKPPSVAFLGWFGPRGSASILYMLVVMKRYDIGYLDEIYLIVIATVLLSVIAHSVTAAPAARV